MENRARDRAVLVLRSAFASLDRANESLGGQVKFRDVDPSGILADLERAGLRVVAVDAKESAD